MLWLKLTVVESIVGGVFATGAAIGPAHGNTLTTIGVIAGAIVLIIAGLFTIKALIASTWKDEAEAQTSRADRLERQCNDERQEQQKIRHELKEQIAQLKADALVLAARTDLTAHEAAAQQRYDASLAHQRQQALLNQERHDATLAVLQAMADSLNERGRT